MADITTNVGGHVARLVEPAEDPAEPGRKKRPWWQLWGEKKLAVGGKGV